MKYFFLNFIFLSSIFVLLAQNKEVAPFGGRIIEKGFDIVFKRYDGSAIIRYYEDKNNWYLSKSTSQPNILRVPDFVKSSLPVKSVYINSKGEQFTTIDNHNWIKLDVKNYFKFNDDELPIKFNLIKTSNNPVESFFRLEFTLNKKAKIKFQILSIFGYSLKYVNCEFEKGNNKIEVNLEYLMSGFYLYNLTVDNNNLSGFLYKY